MGGYRRRIRHMRGGISVVITAVVALALAPAAHGSVTRIDGTVIKRAQNERSFVLVTRTGRMFGVQTRRSPGVGRIARFGGRKLRTGRYSTRRVRVLGRRQNARVRGAVSQVRPRQRAFRVTTRGASALVRVPAGMSLPRRGRRVDMRVKIDRKGRLWVLPAPAATGSTDPFTVGGSATTSGGRGGSTSGGGATPPADEGRQKGFIFMDGVIVEIDYEKRTIKVSPEEDDADDAEAEPEDDESLPQGSAGERRQAAPVMLTADRSIDISRFKTGHKVRMVLKRDASGDLVIEDAWLAGENDGSEPDPEDGED
jgi:hypothetical protein